jgi:tetratricopeptide (TPR) repeat protein
MDIINRIKAFKLFGKYFWKAFLGIGAICTVFGWIVFDDLKDHWLPYVFITLTLASIISLLLLINDLIKREIADKTNSSIPDQLLDIMSKLPPSGAEILSSAIQRYLYLSGHKKELESLGKLIYKKKISTRTEVESLIDSIGWNRYKKKNGNTKQAIDNITKGVVLATQNNLYYWAAKGERHLAGIERHEGNMVACLDHLHKSAEYTKQIQNDKQKTEMEASLYLFEAKNLLDQKVDLLNAEKKAKDAMELFASVGDLERQIKVYAVLGNIYLELRDWDKAHKMFSEGYSKSKDVRNDERAKNALGLAIIYLTDDTDNYFSKKDAKKYLDAAASLKEDLSNKDQAILESLKQRL